MINLIYDVIKLIDCNTHKYILFNNYFIHCITLLRTYHVYNTLHHITYCIRYITRVRLYYLIVLDLHSRFMF